MKRSNAILWSALRREPVQKTQPTSAPLPVASSAELGLGVADSAVVSHAAADSDQEQGR